MVDVDTFLTILYVMIDDFCQSQSSTQAVHPGPQGSYIADKGFAGDKPHARWREQYEAEVITPPHQRSQQTWSKEWRRWLAGLR